MRGEEDDDETTETRPVVGGKLALYDLDRTIDCTTAAWDAVLSARSTAPQGRVDSRSTAGERAALRFCSREEHRLAATAPDRSRTSNEMMNIPMKEQREVDGCWLPLTALAAVPYDAMDELGAPGVSH
jgi:hypothetical protein